MKTVEQRQRSKNEELSPKQVERATMEIIKDTLEILTAHNLKGVITNIEIGLLPHRKEQSAPGKNYDFLYNDLFSLLIDRKK